MIHFIIIGIKYTSLNFHFHLFTVCIRVYSEAMRFSFGPIIQEELNVLVNEWNHHYIRKSRHSETPGGIPEMLYFIPEESGKYNKYCLYTY